MSHSAAAEQLTPMFLNATIEQVTDGLPMPEDPTPERMAERREMARISLLAHDPRTPQEATIAALMILAQHGSMECFRRIASPDMALTLRLRLQSRAAALMRLSLSLLRELLRRQAERMAQAREAQPAVARAAAPAQAVRPAVPPTAHPAAPTPPAPQPPHNHPMSSGKHPMSSGKHLGMAGATAALPSGAFDPASIGDIARRAVAAAAARAA